jgi:predicted N-acetyltransferase YhbS
LAVDRGWSPEETRWKLLLSIGEGWGLDDPSGGLAATVLLTRFPPNLAVVGMLLVRQTRSRSGLGRLLLEHVLARAGSSIVFLYATEIGRPLYERLGFVPAETSARHFGSWNGGELTQSSSARAMTADDIHAVATLDRQAFGADRRLLLTGLTASADRTIVLEHGGAIVAFGVAWRNLDRVQLGPIVAPDEDAARIVIAALARGQELPLRIDLSGRWPALSDWVREHGLAPQTSVPLMVLGGRILPGDRAGLIAVATLATG